jgi:hypothetical protein
MLEADISVPSLSFTSLCLIYSWSLESQVQFFQTNILHIGDQKYKPYENQRMGTSVPQRESSLRSASFGMLR